MTASHPFDRATTLDKLGESLRGGHTSDDYWAFVGPFGGISSATLLRSVLEHPDRIGDPLALTVNFCAPLTRGPFEVETRPARTNRSTQHWTLTLRQGGDTILTGTAVTAERRESWQHAPMQAPPVPPPDELQPFEAALGASSWLRQYEFRFADGAIDPTRASKEAPASARSTLWLRDAQPRSLDHAALASMADAFFGRVFHAVGQIVPYGTVSLSTYFTGTADEIAASGTAPLLGVADAKRFHRSYCDQTVELWSSTGILLATSVQVAYFKA